jgi:hypothetical protein
MVCTDRSDPLAPLARCWLAGPALCLPASRPRRAAGGAGAATWVGPFGGADGPTELPVDDDPSRRDVEGPAA